MNIGYLITTDGACDYYRAELPLRTMARNSDNKVERFAPKDNIERLGDVFGVADAILMPRMADEKFLEVIKHFKKDGKKLVIDHDDDLFNVSPLSNHYAEFGLENVEAVMPNGDKMMLWEDNENFSIKENEERIGVIKRCLEVADMITVTTDILAESYKRYNDNVVAIPNCIDSNIWNRLPLNEREDVRIGWFGGSSHFEDLALVQDVLVEIVKTYPNVKIVIMGQQFPSLFKKIPKNRIELHGWCPTPAYSYKAAILDLDICFIPLRDTKFNVGKSSIKWVEQASLKVPCVSTNMSPYKEIHRGDNGVFIQDNNPQAWFDGLSLLIKNKGVREKIGNNAYDYAMKNFDIQTQWKQWDKAYKSMEA